MGTRPMNNDQRKERNQHTRKWPECEPKLSEIKALKALMTTLPEVDVDADEEWKRKRIEHAPCLNFRR